MTIHRCRLHGERPAALVCAHLTSNAGLRARALLGEHHDRWELVCERCAADPDPGDLEVVCDICQLGYARLHILSGYRGARPPAFAAEWARLPRELRRSTRASLARRRRRILLGEDERAAAALRLLPAAAPRLGGRLARSTLRALQRRLVERPGADGVAALAAFLANPDTEIRKLARTALEEAGCKVRRGLRGAHRVRPRGGEWLRIEAPAELVAVRDQVKG